MKKKIFVSLTLLSLAFSYQAANAQAIGDTAADFSFKDLEGTTHTLADYKGKVVFLFVFGNGCPYCEDAGPATETQVNKVYKEKGDFQALGLDTWNNSTTATVGGFKAKTNITYPLLLQAKSFEALYKTSYDRVMVIDQEGIIRHKNNALAAEKDLPNAIAVLEQIYLAMDVVDAGVGPKTGMAAAYPNPSSLQLSLNFTLKDNDRVRIRMYNPIGQEVKQIVDNILPAGEHQRELSVHDLSPGIYFIRMETAGRSWTQKIQVSR